MKTRIYLALALALARSLPAQVDELSLIRDATTKEQAGDFAGAQIVLQQILQGNPQSLSALMALERVARMENKLADLVPYVQAHLKADNTSAIGHQMLVRTYSALNNVVELERASEAWIKAVPRVETPYREIARVWESRGDYTKALQYLSQGRSKVTEPDALALELGDAYAGIQDYQRAAQEWHRAIGVDGRGLLLVQRRLGSMKDGGAQIIPTLIEGLTRGSPTLPRQRAAVQLAIDAGLSDRAEQAARATVAQLKGKERQNFLIDVARRADASLLPRVALWAYSELGLGDFNPEQSLAIRARIAELALTIGDTVTAARSYKDLEQQLVVGSPQRRQAAALRVGIMVKEGHLADAEKELAALRTEFANAPELDAAAAAVASAYLDKDDVDNAESSLIGISGARSSVARARVALRRGDVTAARNALLMAAPQLQGSEATETIRLATLLGKVSKDGGELLSKAIARAGAGSNKEAVTMLEKSVEVLPELERPSVLDFAAALADRAQLPLEAERARRRIIIDFPRSAEAPSALLTLARSLTERADAIDEARQYLEKLILEYPRSALVPQARQELDRLQGRVPRS